MVGNNETVNLNIPTGFWVIGEECLADIRNKDFEKTNLDDFVDCINSYYDASVFLKGSCQLFALGLHEKYGYETLNLRTELNPNAHYFCKTNYMGKEVYIDVRGVTENLNDVVSPFVYGKQYQIITYNFEDEQVLSKEDKYGLEFAKRIINAYSYFYNINELFKKDVSS